MTKRTLKTGSTFFLVFFGLLTVLFQKGFGAKSDPTGDLLGTLHAGVAYADFVGNSDCSGCADCQNGTGCDGNCGGEASGGCT